MFRAKKTPQEIVKENQRLLNKSIRELDRERTKMETQERKLIVDIKKYAKANQTATLHILAKDLVRTRNYITKFMTLRAHLQAVSLRLQSVASTQAMSSAMIGVSKALGAMNQQINMPGIQAIMQEFEMQNMGMEMKEEMMNDAMEDAFTEDGDQEASQDIINQVLDEIGIHLGESLTTPSGKVPQVAQEEDEFASRLANLRKA